MKRAILAEHSSGSGHPEFAVFDNDGRQLAEMLDAVRSGVLEPRNLEAVIEMAAIRLPSASRALIPADGALCVRLHPITTAKLATNAR